MIFQLRRSAIYRSIDTKYMPVADPFDAIESEPELNFSVGDDSYRDQFADWFAGAWQAH